MGCGLCLTSVRPEARSRAAVGGRGPVRVWALWGGFCFLCDPPGLAVEWAGRSLPEGQRISIPEPTYSAGCVKDADEGLEVSADPGGRGAAARAFS